MTPLLERFIPEARDLIQAASANLLTLEKSPTDAGAINALFRAVHTLKGSSGLFDAAPLTRLVHAGEDLLGSIRAGETQFTSEIADVPAWKSRPRLGVDRSLVGRGRSSARSRENIS